MVIKNATIFDEDFNKKYADIKIENGKIIGIGDYSHEAGLDMTGCIVTPGFIDIHIHGCGGADFCDNQDAIQTISSTLLSHGITSFCGTTMTLDNKVLTEIVENAKAVKGKEKGSKLVGINLEGPFISVAKKGAQNKKYVRPGTIDEFRQLNEDSGSLVKFIDIAPESFDSDDFIKEVSKNATVSIGHSNATAEQAKKAIELGVCHVTHLFNAMTSFNHRETGIIGAVFDDDNVTCELICDGQHVSPVMIRIAFKILGENRICVISDSMRAAGSNDGEYELGGQKVFVKDNLARLADGTIAASVTNIYLEFKNLLSFGIDEKIALKACTINPARALKEDHSIGSIAVGKDADLVIFDNNYNIKNVVLKGEFGVQ